MATIQERLSRMKQDGQAATVQQRLNQMKRDGQTAQTQTAAPVRAESGVTLPTAQQGMVTLPRADQGGWSGGTGFPSAPSVSAAGRLRTMPDWAVSPSFTPNLGWRTPESIQTEINGVDSTIRELKRRQSELNGQAQLLDNRVNAWGRLGYTDLNGEDSRQSAQLRSQAGELAGQIAQLESDRAGLQKEWERADDIQFDLNMIRDKSYQAAVDKAMGAEYGWDTVSSEKPAHMRVGHAISYFQALDRGDDLMAVDAAAGADMALEYMSDSQRNRLAYYVGTGDYDSAAEYLDRIAPALNRKRLDETEQVVTEWSKEHPIQGAAANILSWPLNIPAYAANTKQAAKNLITGKDEQDSHVRAYELAKVGTGTAQGTQEAARSAATQTFGNEFAGDAAAFLTGTGLSIGQNATQIALLGPGSLAAMSMSAAGSSTADALDRGATPQQAFLVGTAGGAIEAITEKLPLENLFRLAKNGGGQGLKATVKELLKQMGTEASEEMISEIANNLVDTAVMGDSSEFQLYVKELQAAGLSKEEAERQAFRQFYLINVGLAGLGGGISGGVMSGGALAFHRAGELNQQLNVGKQGADETNAAIDRAYQAMVRKGPWDGIYLPATEQDTVTSPRGENTAGGVQEAAERARQDGGIITPAAGQLAPQEARGTVAGQNKAASTEKADGGNKRLQEIAAEAQTLREEYAQGRMSDENFDAAMDVLQEQAELEGLGALQADALLNGTAAYETEGGTDNGSGTAAPEGQKLSGGIQERVFDQGAGGQDGVLAESGSRRAVDPGRAAVERQAAGRALRLQEVSSRELGIVNGTDARTVRMLPENAWDGALRETARKVRRETGLGVRFVLGGIQVTGSDGEIHQVRGAYSQDGIIVQADHLRVSPEQIADHEIFHSYADSDPGLIRAVEDSIVERYGQEEMDRITDAYIKNLRGIVDIPEAGTDLDFEQAYADIKNEVFADAFAGINAFGANAGQYQGAVLDALEDRGTGMVQSRENAQAMDSRRGPPVERFSLEKFPDGQRFVDLDTDQGLFDGLSDREKTDLAVKIIRERFAGRIIGSDNPAFVNSASAREYGHPVKNIDSEIRDAKMRAAPELNHLMDAGFNYRAGQDGQDGHVHPRATGGFEYYDVIFKVGDNFFQGVINLEVNNRGRRLKDVTKIRNVTQDIYGSYGQDPKSVFLRNASTDNIPQSGAAVKGDGLFFPTAEQGTVTLPGGEDTTGRTRFSADEDGPVSDSDTSMDGIMMRKGSEALDGSMLPTLAEAQARKAQAAQGAQTNAENVSDSDTAGRGNSTADQTRVKGPREKKSTEPVAKSKPIIAKRELRQTMLNLFSIPEGMRAELGAEVDRLADRALKNGGLSQSDRDAFFDRMYESGVMELEVEAHQEAGRNAVKGKKIYVPSSVKSEFGGSAEWNEFRKRAFAAGILLTNERGDNGIDTLNAELSQTLPGLFDPSETDSRVILERVVQMAEEGQSEKVSLIEYTAMLSGQGYVSENEVLDNLERQMDWALRTFAEKANLELKLRNRTGVKLAQQRDAYHQRDEARRMREIQRQAAEREQRREAAQQKREAKELREMQSRTLKQLQWLKRNMDRAPSELREAFGEVLGDLDIYAVGAAKATRWNKKHGATWQDLAEMYENARENDPNFLPSKELDRIVARIKGTKVGDLDVDALQDLYKAAVGLRTEFENRKQIVHDKMRRQVAEVYYDSLLELDSAPGAGKAKGGWLDKVMNEEQLSPINMMERMVGWNPDSTFYSMAKQLEQGERDIRAYTVEANRQLADFLNEYKDWVKKSDGQGKDAIWYEIEVPEFLEYGQGHKPIFGDTVKVYMTPAQKVHMYLESQGVDNLRHMEGGRTFVNKELYAKGKRQEAFAQGTTIRLAPETVQRLVSDLTLEEKAMARALEGYYNQFAKDRINKVSNALYGYDKAMGKYYAPIYTNANYNTLELGVYDDTAEGVGRMKSRVYSITPSYNLSAMDAFERHVEQTARFVGMSIPHRNWDVLLNWEEHEGTHPPVPFRQVIANCWGDAGIKYIQDTIQSLQGSKKSPRADSVSTGMDKLFSNYISAVFGANPSIVFKQMGSIPMAAAWLEFKNFPNPAQIAHIDRALIAKYTQELDWRTMGYSMPETKQLKDNPNWSQTNKFTSFVFGGDAITAMDGWAASVLWPWAENKVRRDNPDLKPGTQEQIDSGTDPFYQKVAEVFNDTVARSQSTSDEMHQGSLRKSKNMMARTLTMFKSDSSQLYNALRQMAGEASYYKRIKDDKNTKKARRKLGAALLAAIGGYIWAEGVEFLMNLWKKQGKKYRDDEGGLTVQSVVSEMGQGLVSDLAGVVAGGEELTDILGNIVTGDTWYGIGTPGLEQLTDVIELIQQQGAGAQSVLLDAADVVKNRGNLKEYLRRHSADIIGGIKETAAAAATYLPGLPVNNLEAYMLGTVRWISPELAAAYEDTLTTATKNRLSGLSGDALTQRIDTLFDVRNVNLEENGAEAISMLYEAGWKGAVPSDTPGKIRVNSEDRQLSAYQQQVYDQVWSTTIGSAINDLVNSKEFRSADDESREQMLKSLYSYAGEKAKAVLFDDYSIDDAAREADAFLTAGASTAQWAAWQGQLSSLGRTAKEEGRSVKDAEKLNLLQGQDWPDEVKIAAVGTILGTKLKTDSGKPTQYAKLLEAVEAGGSVDTWLAAKTLTPAVGTDSVSDAQRWRAILDATSNPADQKTGLLAVMSDSARMRFEVADGFGIQPEAWVQLKEALPQFDENGNGSYSGAEVEAAIDALGGDGSLLAPWDKEPLRLSREEKAVLWQLYTGNKSGSGNPYSTRVGKQVVAALEEAREEEKGKE